MKSLKNLIQSASAVCTFVLLLTACSDDIIFDKYEEIPNSVWTYENQPVFKVDVTDTSTLYNIYVSLRHTRYFEFRNLWVKIHTYLPDNDTLVNRVDLPLAKPSGEWHGRCSGDICHTSVPIQYNALFKHPGTYGFRVEQNMRLENLPEIMSVGILIEKGDER